MKNARVPLVILFRCIYRRSKSFHGSQINGPLYNVYLKGRFSEAFHARWDPAKLLRYGGLESFAGSQRLGPGETSAVAPRR